MRILVWICEGDTPINFLYVCMYLCMHVYMYVLGQGEKTAIKSHFLLFLHTRRDRREDNFIGFSKP